MSFLFAFFQKLVLLLDYPEQYMDPTLLLAVEVTVTSHSGYTSPLFPVREGKERGERYKGTYMGMLQKRRSNCNLLCVRQREKRVCP